MLSLLTLLTFVNLIRSDVFAPPSILHIWKLISYNVHRRMELQGTFYLRFSCVRKTVAIIFSYETCALFFR